MAAQLQAHPTTLTVLISGSGTNLQAIIDACSSGALPCKIIRVLSNKKDAYGLTRAENAQIPTTYHNLVKYKKQFPVQDGSKAASAEARLAYDRDLASLVLQDKPDMVVCAGWMHILAPTFLTPLDKAGVPVVNLHPALPGEFNGINAIERAYAAWRAGEIKRTGVMIHHVIQEVDMGEPITTKEIEFREGEGLDEFEKRVHEVEWKVIVEGVGLAVEELRGKRAGGS